MNTPRRNGPEPAILKIDLPIREGLRRLVSAPPMAEPPPKRKRAPNKPKPAVAPTTKPEQKA